MPTYRVKDGIDRELPGIGRTVNGMITTNATIEHPLFEIVTEPAAQPAPSANVTPAPTPQAAPVQPPQPGSTSSTTFTEKIGNA